jgi:small multidrug resistance family-3 protein
MNLQEITITLIELEPIPRIYRMSLSINGGYLMLQLMEIARSLFFFLLAGLCEIGGGYLIWLWIRDGRGIGFALLGAAILVLYGIIPTFQPANFGRVYAAYGGIFIFLSILWGWQIDKIAPDRFDLIGGFIALIGVIIIMYWPRA